MARVEQGGTSAARAAGDVGLRLRGDSGSTEHRIPICDRSLQPLVSGGRRRPSAAVCSAYPPGCPVTEARPGLLPGDNPEMEPGTQLMLPSSYDHCGQE